MNSKDTNNNLLFIYTNYSSFVREDYNILKSRYNITKYHFPISSPLRIIPLFIRQFFWLAFNIFRYKKVYIWFGDYHSFLPILFCKIFKIESYLVLGGYDVCHIPEIHYGSFKNKLRGFCTLFSMNNCTLNLSVSKYVDRKLKAIARKAKSTVIYNGIVPTKDNIDFSNKEDIVLTVGIINSTQRIKIKGIDVFMETAKHMPETKFMIVGASEALLKDYFKTIPENVTIIDFCDQKELAGIYKKAKVYCQFSMIESFCVTLAEAMLYGCIPVVSHAGAMPEIVINNTYITRNNIEAIIGKISAGLKADDKEREMNSDRIKDKFLLKYREEGLQRVL